MTWRHLYSIGFSAALLACSNAPSEDEALVMDELDVSREEASALIDQYGDPADAIDDYIDSSGSDYYGGSYSSDYDGEDEREEFDEDLAREAAERELALQGYDYSYGCTDDCSGHEAGWQWRADNGYSTYGNSQSFAEGGWAFDEAVDERVDEMRDDYEDGYDTDY